MTTSARNRVCQSAVLVVPHHCANSGNRSTSVGWRTRGQWLPPLGFGLLLPGIAPGLSIRIRVGVQQHLIDADHARAVRIFQRLLLRSRARREPGVVVKLEERNDRHGTGRAWPDCELVLWREDVVLLAHLDEGLVAGLSAQW